MAAQKEKDKLSDADCVQVPMLAYNAQCQTHGQPLSECANGRMKQVKSAREMADRRTRWAHVWKESACANRIEINKIKAGV